MKLEEAARIKYTFVGNFFQHSEDMQLKTILLLKINRTICNSPFFLEVPSFHFYLSGSLKMSTFNLSLCKLDARWGKEFCGCIKVFSNLEIVWFCYFFPFLTSRSQIMYF